jgi:predicted alpha/beta superfamily hydrolase
MKGITLLIVFLLTVTGFSQKTKDSILSKKLDSYRFLSISTPKSYDNGEKKVYPLLLLLDGDYLFDPFTGVLSYGNYWDDLPEMIVVGLDQNKEGLRFKDCSVSRDTGLPDKDGSKFFEFIGGELLPFIEKKYRISSFKAIAGHDVTAGFLNFFLYKEDPLFNAYIFLSPELAVNMENVVAGRLTAIKKPIFYYLASADGDIKKMKEDAQTLNANISQVKNESLNYMFDDIKQASHYSLVVNAIPNALYQFFAAYQPISNLEFQEKIIKLPSGYVDYLTDKYAILDKVMGMKMNIRYNDFKAIEAAIVKNKAYNEFEKLAQLSNKMYPKTMLGDYHMGMYYEYQEDFKRASKSYLGGYQREEIGSLTKDFMLSKSDELRSKIKK